MLMLLLAISTETTKCQPHGGARRNVNRSSVSRRHPVVTMNVCAKCHWQSILQLLRFQSVAIPTVSIHRAVMLLQYGATHQLNYVGHITKLTVPRLWDKSIEQLTVPWHKQPDSWADHAAPCLSACSHLHTVGWVEFLHSYKGHGGVTVDLKWHTTTEIV